MATAFVDMRPSTAQAASLARGDVPTVSAICNRVSRMLGLPDREGLRMDIAIIQANKPLDLEALAGAPDQLFVDELRNLTNAVDRESRSLRSDFTSELLLETNPERLN